MSFMSPAPRTQSPWGPTSPVTLGGKSKHQFGGTQPFRPQHTLIHMDAEKLCCGDSTVTHLIQGVVVILYFFSHIP